MPMVAMTVNGRPISAEVEARTLLVELLRSSLGLTGTHVGCDTSQCGACVVAMNGRTVKACTVLAVQAAEAAVITIEGLATGEVLHPMQTAFREHHALQCGFCTPGMVLSAIELAQRLPPAVTPEAIREGLEGNLCRCTGYHNIVAAVGAGATAMRGKG